MRGASSEASVGGGRCRGTGKQSQLTIFCDATGAGSSLYFRALSGACFCDMIVIIAGAVVVEGSGRVGPGAKTRVRVDDAVARPAQFHAQRSPASREGESEAHGQQIQS
jgi:hypothetical protein